MTGEPRLLSVIGPTGCGKSAFAVELAKRLGAEVCNFDSVQLYRGFDIGSAKMSKEQMQGIPHHLIDVASWNEPFDAQRYRNEAMKVEQAVCKKALKPLILVGGTGLYLRAFLGQNWHGNAPKQPAVRALIHGRSNQDLARYIRVFGEGRFDHIHVNDRFRLERAAELALMGASTQQSVPERACLTISLEPEKAAHLALLEKRCHEMLRDGLLNEVRGLLSRGVDPGCGPMSAIGYRECVAALGGGKLDMKELSERIFISTRQYAKRQRTWFRGVRKDVIIQVRPGKEDVLQWVDQVWPQL